MKEETAVIQSKTILMKPPNFTKIELLQPLDLAPTVITPLKPMALNPSLSLPP